MGLEKLLNWDSEFVILSIVGSLFMYCVYCVCILTKQNFNTTLRGFIGHTRMCFLGPYGMPGVCKTSALPAVLFLQP